jgi:TonB-linked SusC/RagA family outer membrane protein
MHRMGTGHPQKIKNMNLNKKQLLLLALALSYGLGSMAGNQPSNIDNNKAPDKNATLQQTGRTITGTVKDKAGEPMIGVSIMVDGTSQGCVSDIDGNFSLPNVADNAVLKVTYVGFKEQKIAVSGKSSFNIVLEEDNQTLDELVVVGYGVVKKSDLTGAVGSIHSDEIVEKGAGNLAGSLQGSVAGVNISQASSRVGDSFTMQIRGKSSLQGGEPLYVVDGVVCDNIDFLNPMDIDKVDVLKDASSTAIYGSRATNGVLMISTKKGTEMGEAKVTVSYDGYYGFKEVANMPDFMDGQEWMNYRLLRYYTLSHDTETGATTWTLPATALRTAWCMDSPRWKEKYKNQDFTDWPDLVTRNGHEQNHFVNITGNTKSLSYRIGLGYQNEAGVLYDDYERWNAKVAVDGKINEHWMAGASVNLATSLKQSGSTNSVKNGFNMSPMMDAYYWEGENEGELIRQPGKDTAIYPNGGGPTSTLNPIVDRENSKDNTRAYNAMGNLYLQYSPIKELIFKTTLSPSYQRTKRGEFYAGNMTELRNGKTNYAKTTNVDLFSYTWDTQANFVKDFGDHTINALAVFSAYQQKTEGDGITVTDMPFDVDWYNTGSASTVEDKSSYYEKITMLSYVLRLNYDYKDRYLLTVSSRWDGSSKFQKDNRWGCFPSAAVAWRITEEPWMSKTANWLSNLKLRLSFGITGNNGAVGPYQTQLLANNKYYYNFGSTVVNGYGYDLSNSDLTWEKTTEFDAGLDFGFLNGRISGTFDFYTRTSRDLLMEMETPLEMGSYSGAIWDNVGKVRNTGVEVQLNTVNIKTKDLTWTTNFTFAHNKNKILELNGGKQDMTGNGWFIGQPIDVVYGYKRVGICTAEQAAAYAQDDTKKTKFYEGEYMVADLNNDGTIDPSDRCVQGHAEPDWTGSLNSTLTWKNFDFSFNIYTSQGSTVYSPFMAEFADYSQRGKGRLSMDLYIPKGIQLLDANGELYTVTETHYGSYPLPNQNDNMGCGQFWVRDETGSQYFVDNSFTKIKNIILGYTFPKKWISHLGLSYLRVYVNFVNPFVFTDYKGFDPEWADASVSDGTGGPSSRSYQIGLSLKF